MWCTAGSVDKLHEVVTQLPIHGDHQRSVVNVDTRKNGLSLVSELPDSIDNPYDSGHCPESEAAIRPRRPVGTVILASFLLLSGLWFGGQRCYQLTSAFSSGDNVVIHPSYYVSLTRDLITTSTAIVGSIAMIFGLNLGWWLTILHGYWRLAVQCVLPLFGAVTASATAQAPMQSRVVSAALIAGVLFMLMVLYLQQNNVRAYFRVHARRTVVNIAMGVLCVGVALALDLWWALTQQPLQ